MEGSSAPVAPRALAVHRYAAGLTQAELAAEARISRSAVAKLEGGQCSPRRLTAESIARALGVEAADLFQNDDGRADDAAAVTTTAGTGRSVER